jgi:hypothetical protein
MEEREGQECWLVGKGLPYVSENHDVLCKSKSIQKPIVNTFNLSQRTKSTS